MLGIHCNLLGKKIKSDSNSLNLKIQEPFSTKINSSAFPSPIPYQYSPINEVYDPSIQNKEDILLSPLFRNDDSINDQFLNEKMDDNNLFINDTKNNNIVCKLNSFLENSESSENEENSIIELIECTNILSQRKQKLFNGVVINNKKGRKTTEQKEKVSEIKGEHNKYSPDNMLRKAKVIAFETILQTINSILINIDVNKKLKILKNEQVRELNVSYNKELLITKIKDIFSKEISSKYVVDLDYNEKMIKSIYEEKEKYTEVIKILEKTLEECFQDFRDKEENENKLKKMLKKIIDVRLQKETNEYKDGIMKKINNFERIFREIKKPRNSKKKLNKE